MRIYPQMPEVIPIPAKTRGLPWWKATWNWLTVPTFWLQAEDYLYRMTDGTWVLFKKGFKFDGASIPRAFWPLINPDGIMFLQGEIHDHGYRFNNLFMIAASDDLLKPLNNAWFLSCCVDGTDFKEIDALLSDPDYLAILLMHVEPWRKGKETQSFWDDIFYKEGNAINGMMSLNFIARQALRAFGYIAWNRLRGRNEAL